MQDLVLQGGQNRLASVHSGKRRCAVDGCENPSRTRGWCYKHYARWRAHGDPTALVRTENGEPQRYLIEVVFAYEGDDCLIWPYNRSNHGYGLLRVDGRHKIVSRLVCEEINGPPPTPEHEAAHSCGKGHEGCVTKSHLSWKTSAENHADKLIHGTHDRGERSPRAKLTEAEVRAIRRLAGTMRLQDISDRFGVCMSHVSAIIKRQRWAWLK